MRVVDIVEGTSVDGPGLRTTIYFAGCTHHCKGCHNPQTWDSQAGRDMSIDEILSVIEEAGFNVTFSGGDPLQQPIEELIELAKGVRALGYNIWCYTGYTFEAIQADNRLSKILEHIDTIVDGPFIQHLRDTSLHFRGSSNQRIIHLSDSSLRVE